MKSPSDMSDLMTDEEFRLIRNFIYDYCGIFVPDSMKFLVERRLRSRLRVLGLQSFREYYRRVRYAENRVKELNAIVELVSTNETYFFREPHQLRAFTDEIIPVLLASRPPDLPIRIWSAGCSSGEEPYTIAMLLDQMPAARGRSFEIFGSDISRKAIRMAREAEYRDASFRETSHAMRRKYFVREGRTYRLTDTIRERVTFGHLNLMDEAAMGPVANVDVIFCRNVMIYFSKPSRASLVGALYRKLREGGYLLLGHSESLINVSTDFEVLALENDIVYRKPANASPGNSWRRSK